MKQEHRGLWLVRLGAGLALAAGLARGAQAASDESAQPVFQETAAPATPEAAAKSLKRELDATRARLADVEAALARQTAAKKKAADDIVKLWQQVKAERENAEQLQRQLAGNAKQVAQARDLEKQVAGQAAQLTELQRKLAAAQTDADRRDQTLAETQGQHKAAMRTAELALKKRQEELQAAEVARTAAENRALTLAQEKAQIAARAQELERALTAEKGRAAAALEQQKAEQAKTAQAQAGQQQQELAALRRILAEKDKALAQLGRQAEKLQAEVAAAQRQLRADAGGDAARTRAEARAKELEQENAELAKAVQTQASRQRQELEAMRSALAEKDQALAQARRKGDGLRRELASAQEQAQSNAQAATATQRQLRQELAGLRQQTESQTPALAALKAERSAQDQQLAAKTRELAQLDGQLQQLRQAQRSQADDLAKCQAQLAKSAREAQEQSRQQLADLNRAREQMKEADLVRQGKALREQLGEQDRAALASSLNDVGLLLLAEGQLDQAQEMFQRALAGINQTQDKANAAAGTVLQHLAEVAWGQDNLAAAASLYEDAAQQFSAALGSAHPRYAAALNGWARVRQDQHRPEEAEELYRMAIHIYERDADRNPGDLVAPLHNLGLLLLEEDRLDEAGPLLERAEALLHEDPAGDAARALIVARTLTRYYRTAGDVAQAAAYETQANELALEALSK